ncbi:hypothetical protein [Campylobacter rectus]|uniref:hypothetical protein n=1 Tax=Campylobacter rectus TaxID=203 RepID=UPI0028DC5557|nr:hypothetical protein [Campylobacter rectus]
MEPKSLRAGAKILLSGDAGRHGAVVPASREEFLQGSVNLQSGFNGDANAQMQGLNLKCKESDGENKNVKFSQSGDLSQQILLSERATACFKFSDDSRFLAFAEWIVDKMQLVKVLRLANITLTGCKES